MYLHFKQLKSISDWYLAEARQFLGNITAHIVSHLSNWSAKCKIEILMKYDSFSQNDQRQPISRMSTIYEFSVSRKRQKFWQKLLPVSGLFHKPAEKARP